MPSRFITACMTLFLFACGSSNSSNQLYGEVENSRELGTVLSVSQNSHLEANGISDAATNVGANAASTTAASMVGASSLFSPLSGSVSQLGSMVGGSGSVSVGDVSQLKYVIRKDNGDMVTINQIPEEGDPIAYTGQRVMIQSNGDYVHVYLADVEHRRSQ